MTIAVDVDDVCAALIPEWIAWYNKKWNDNLDVTKIDCWDMTKHVKPICGKRIYEILDEPNLYYAVLPIEGALRGVQSLAGHGHRIVYVTASTGKQMEPKLLWLNRHGFMDLPHNPTYMACIDKSLVRADWMIDDGPHNLEVFKGGVTLFDQPHNRADRRFTRAKDWDHVTQILLKDRLNYVDIEIAFKNRGIWIDEQ